MKLNAVNTETLRSLQKALDTELKNREDLQVGTYNVAESLTLNVNATVQKCEDEECIPTAKIAHKAALALFVRHCGITRDAALQALETAMKDSLELNDKSEEYIAALADIKHAEEKVTAMLKALPKAKRTGKILIKVKVD